MKFFHRRSGILWLTDKATASNEGDLLLDFFWRIKCLKGGKYVGHNTTTGNTLARAKMLHGSPGRPFIQERTKLLR